MKVFNLLDGREAYYINDVSPEWATAVEYCGENNLMSALLAAQQDGRLDAFYKTLPFTRGKHSLACGDWASVTTNFKE